MCLGPFSWEVDLADANIAEARIAITIDEYVGL